MSIKRSSILSIISGLICGLLSMFLTEKYLTLLTNFYKSELDSGLFKTLRWSFFILLLIIIALILYIIEKSKKENIKKDITHSSQNPKVVI